MGLGAVDHLPNIEVSEGPGKGRILQKTKAARKGR